MSDLTFFCNPVDTFDLAELPRWVARQRDRGLALSRGPLTVEVVHRDREADGSCRWCGCRADDVVIVNAAG